MVKWWMSSIRADLASAMAAAARSVGPYSQQYPAYLQALPGRELFSLDELVRPEVLRTYAADALSPWSDHPGDEDARAGVSRLARRYVGALTTAVLSALAHGIGIEAPRERARVMAQDDLSFGIVLDVGEVLLCRERPASWPIAGRELRTLDEMRDRVLGAYLGHCAWLFDQIIETIKVSPRLLWSTAAEQIDFVYEYAASGPARDVFARAQTDRELLLFAERAPGVAVQNPMKDLLRWEAATDGPDAGHRIQVRDVCCMNFVVSGRAQVYCRNCGLVTPPERRAMWSKWRASVRAQGSAG
jgi:hypothetical protein